MRAEVVGIEQGLAAEDKSTETATLDEMERHWQDQKLRDRMNRGD